MELTLDDFLPQGETIRSLKEAIREERLAHAWLITGEKGTGKRTLARLMAMAVLCEHPGEKPCCVCRTCVRIRQEEYPDVITLRAGRPVSPEVKPGRATIPVDDIREVIRRTGEHALEGDNRVVLIENAEKMTPQAQNCLLKTLEEPPEGVFFFLTAAAPSLLLTTIVSRCRPLPLHAWSDAFVRVALKRDGVPETHLDEAVFIASGSVGTALEMAKNEAYWERRQQILTSFFSLENRSAILSVSNAWKDRKEEADALLDEIGSLAGLLLEVRMGRVPEKLIASFPAPWRRMAKEGGPECFCRLMDAVTAAKRMKASSVGLQAILENLMMKLMEEKSQWLK